MTQAAKSNFGIVSNARIMSSDYKRHKNYSKYLPNIKTVAVYGGSSINDQIRSLREKPQIIVGTRDVLSI